MKESYERPSMVTETIEIGTLFANAVGSPVPIAQLEPYFGLCPPCP